MRRNASRKRPSQLELQLLVSYSASKNPHVLYSPFTLSTRREQYTGYALLHTRLSLPALSSFPRELLEPIVAVDDFFIFIINIDGVVS